MADILTLIAIHKKFLQIIKKKPTRNNIWNQDITQDMKVKTPRRKVNKIKDTVVWTW